MAPLTVAVSDILEGTIILTGKEKITIPVKCPTGEGSKDAVRLLRKEAANLRLEEEGGRCEGR